MLRKIEKFPMWAHGGATVLAFGVWQTVRIRLDQMYAASNHPVDYATGQTTFDASQIKGFYAHMQEAGTLDVYVNTQLFDFVFIGMVMVFGILLGTLVARMNAAGSWGRRFGVAAAVFAVTGASLDALENAVSFVMLADPSGFADWLALPYSGFAAAKFAFLTFAMLAALLGMVFALGARLRTKGNV